jgi:hypothetical protein
MPARNRRKNPKPRVAFMSMLSVDVALLEE